MTAPGSSQHEDVEELLGPYALDAVDMVEAKRVEDHLISCPRCRVELDVYREMVAVLGNTVEPRPPDLWDRIADRTVDPTVRKSDSPLALVGGTADGQLASEQLGAVGAPACASRQYQQAHRSGRRRRSLTFVGVAAMVALVAILTVRQVQTDHELGTAQRALSERGDAQVQAAIAAPGHQVLLLRSALGAQVAKIVVSAGRGYFVSSALRPLPRDETYQLWAMFGEQPVSIGLLGARPGHAVFTLASGSPTQLAVTVEPSGGATRPSRLPVASGSFGA